MNHSFGITSTPKLGWGCCTLPPCCEKDKIYWSDNHKTWGETSTVTRGCCGCGAPSVENVRVRPGGNMYDYRTESKCCGPTEVVVYRGQTEVGRSELMCYLCWCDKPAHVVTRNGQQVYTDRYPGCCGKSQGCCGPSRDCCDPWKRYDLIDVQGPEGTTGVIGTITNQHHGCCPCLYPMWTGFDVVPTHDEDEMALLGTFLLNQPLYIDPRRARGLAINTAPATIGGKM